MSKKVKQLIFESEMQGTGIVNYDFSDQRFIFGKKENNAKHNHLKYSNNNVSYSKKDFFYSKNDKGENELDFKIKISSDSLKHSIYRNDLVAQTPAITHNKHILHSYLASEVALLRGVLFTNRGDSLKRKGATTLTDAVQTNDAMPRLEVFSKSGSKEDSSKSDSDSSNNFFYMETVGDMTYRFSGYIDLLELSFISVDQFYDRKYFSEDDYTIFKEYFEKKFGSQLGEVKFYQKRNDVLNMPERGILLTEEQVKHLLRFYIRRLINLEIRRRKAYANVSSLRMKPFYVGDLVIDNNGDNYIDLKSYDAVDEFVDGLSIDYDYVEVDTEEATNLRKDIVDKQMEMKATSDAKKKEKKTTTKKEK